MVFHGYDAVWDKTLGRKDSRLEKPGRGKPCKEQPEADGVIPKTAAFKDESGKSRGDAGKAVIADNTGLERAQRSV